jgi:hypothetical protein
MDLFIPEMMQEKVADNDKSTLGKLRKVQYIAELIGDGIPGRVFGPAGRKAFGIPIPACEPDPEAFFIAIFGKMSQEFPVSASDIENMTGGSLPRGKKGFQAGDPDGMASQEGVHLSEVFKGCPELSFRKLKVIHQFGGITAHFK